MAEDSCGVVPGDRYPAQRRLSVTASLLVGLALVVLLFGSLNLSSHAQGGRSDGANIAEPPSHTGRIPVSSSAQGDSEAKLMSSQGTTDPITPSLILAWSSPEIDDTRGVAWGDWDDDGDLDLAVGNASDQPSRVYANTDGDLSLAWDSSQVSQDNGGIAWGDYDGDDDLDLMISDSVPRVYENRGRSLTITREGSWSYGASGSWVDWDGDGDLDLAIGRTLYTNDGNGNLQEFSAPLHPVCIAAYTVRSSAWGDWDGDGDMDLAAACMGIDPSPNYIAIYRNNRGALEEVWYRLYTASSVAWGDWDVDGDLDLAVGYPAKTNEVYANTGSTFTLAWTAPVTDSTSSVAWGDWDRDGDLDLAVGNHGESRVYANIGADLVLSWTAPEQDETYSVAWGDWDGDGDLDLALGNDGANRVYENTSSPMELVWTLPETTECDSLAWGDWDADGDLDLAVGNWQLPTRVYSNTGHDLVLAWSSPLVENTTSVAWADWDGDGDLDLAVGNSCGYFLARQTVPGRIRTSADYSNDRVAFCEEGSFTRVYANVGGALELAWSAPESGSNSAVAWADWDGDGDLDLAVSDETADIDQPVRVYENSGGNLALAWLSAGPGNSKDLAWGDWDRDGDLDLAVADPTYSTQSYWGGQTRVYENTGGDLSVAWSAPRPVSADEYPDSEFGASSIAWGDFDADGDLDLAFGSVGGDRYPTRVASNTGGDLSLTWVAPYGGDSNVAWADWNGDGALDLAIGATPHSYLSRVRLYKNFGRNLVHAWSAPLPEYPAAGLNRSGLAWGDWDNDGDPDLAAENLGICALYANHAADNSPPGGSLPKARITYPGGPAAPFFATTTILEGPVIPITYTLAEREGNGARRIEAFYSLDGGSLWRPAVAASGTITTDLAASPAGTPHVFYWDVYASDVFGASDTAVFQLDVYQGFSGTGPYQYGSRYTRTLPFRLRGSQVRVMRNGTPRAGASVYRQAAGTTGVYEPYQDSLGRPYRTNPAGYLQGYGELTPGDRLAALLPITATAAYTLYYTSAAPTLTGLDPFTVTAGGVQTLTVSSAHSLVLFNLDVSLEWDARQDTQFLSQLKFDLQRASEFLYDWSNGQAALGRVTVYHDREKWQDAHVRIYATNRLRPNAVMGGIVSEVITDPLTTTLTYGPGQLYMGATWNRYGNPGSSLDEDWPRTLAHELGHYALFLEDNYLGRNAAGLLVPVDSCPGAMADPYRDDAAVGYGEFHPNAGWLPACAQTLSNRLTGRSDWATITSFYPELDGAPDNPGPSSLPLDVTQVQFVEPATPATTIKVPIFFLSQNGQRVQPGNSARAFLFQGGWATDLGRPTLDQLLARGARPGDRVCLYELAAGRLGCETVRLGDEQLALVAVPDWQPEIAISPVTSRTFTLTVTSVPAELSLSARLYPADTPAGDPISLLASADGHAGTFNLAEPAFAGYVQVWVDEAEPRREAVVDFTLGSNPAHERSGGAHERSGGAHERSGGAPVMSADGQVILFAPDVELPTEWFYTLQATSIARSVPPWATLVGRAYRLAATANAPSLVGTSLNFSYLGGEVPPGEEAWLRLYFWGGNAWRQLPTQLDTYHNMASAPTQGPGIYALMSSLEIAIDAPGWNFISYPVAATRPVTEALISITGYYTTVYGYKPADTLDPWKVYDVTVPDWVSDLRTLEFGRGYWINVSQAITLMLRGTSGASVQGAENAWLDLASSVPLPPATYYGPVLAGADFAPAADTPVTAWIDGHLCGRGRTREVGGQAVYTVNVLADGSGAAAGCGAAGRQVAFQVGSRLMATTTAWDISRVWKLALRPASEERLFLPIILSKP